MMRLIDADKMIARHCAEECGGTVKDCHPFTWDDGDYFGICPFVQEIEDEPSVDAEPVRHGRWEIVIVSTSNPYESEIEEKCSICGRFVQRYGTQPQDNYCPNCGAKMDLEEAYD